MRRAIPVLILILMTAYGPLSMLNELEEVQTKYSGETEGTHDVPTWRIGDKWVYETQFDVSALIQQANVSASLNTLTGDTTMEVVDIRFETIQGTQTLVYEMDIEGEFSSGNSGATLEGQTGRLDIDYDGTDILRASDLSMWDSEFTLDVSFALFNIGLFTTTLAELTFATVYEPPREKYDFPLRTGDQWTSTYQSGTNVTGSSDYFDPTTFDSPYVEDNTTYQVTADGEPSEDGSGIDYTGCSDSYKVNNWNNTGTPGGFEWFCPAVRSYAWYRIINPAGFQIDWKLKTYTPVDSGGVNAASSPGIRNVVIDVTPEFVAILPNATEQVVGHMTVNGNDEVGTNLQLRYESDGTIMSLTTDSDGEVTPDLDVGYFQDSSPASDDWTSNGVIIWDPVNKIVGAATIVMDLSVVGVDLVAQPESMIVTRTRGNDSTVLNQASGYNALPGDNIHFSVPAQNRGVLTSPATEMEITTPDGTTIRGNLPALAPYSEGRVDVNWSVPSNAAIGIQTLSFLVDPDETVTADANRSNNDASLDIFIGRMPVANMVLMDNVYTFENVSIDASGSYDDDSGSVTCYFEIQDGIRTEYIDSASCMTSWFWADDGDWEVKVIVVDDELDEVHMTMNATVLNRDPYVNLTSDIPSVYAGESITFNASDSGDIDTISPEGQYVTISWPNSTCTEGLYGPYCTLNPEEEGMKQIEVMVTDDDGANVSGFFSYEVMNVAPTIGEMRLSIDGIPYLPAEDGTWSIDEDVVATLEIDADDTLSDKEDLLITWYPDAADENWTITTSGPNSAVTASWGTSGLHEIKAFAIDDDGETSMDVIGYVRVNNIAPVLDTLPSQQALFEDEILNLTAFATDLADQDDLRYCWDLIVSIDSDNNGITTDDCDVEGPDLVYSWTTPGLRTITANVWDDDNATDSFSIDVTIVNKPVVANIYVPEDGFTITEGESITFSGANSNDSVTDRAMMQFIWDDPNTEGATQDGSGESFTIEFDRPGTYTVNLTVIDDDGDSDTASVIVTVEAKPSEGLFGIGMSTPGIIGGIFGIVIIVLLGVLLLRRGESDTVPIETSNIQDSWNESPSLPFSQPTAAPETVAAPMGMQEPVNTGPPIPASGLPEGWTMEQWAYYGEQYLASMPPAPVDPYAQPAPADPYAQSAQVGYQQPAPTYNPAPTQTFTEPAPSLLNRTMVQEPAPTPASQALADILDDLDL
ncbi:MAG: PKD domain-containing protein [Candidatus Poseidoniaceae archaeon]